MSQSERSIVIKRLLSRVFIPLLCTAGAPVASHAQTLQSPPSGALIQIMSNSTVGVLLDEIPAGPLREAAAANALAEPNEFWIARAKDQVRLMSYRLIFRSGYHNTSNGAKPVSYGPLPLPPQRDKWNIAVSGAPRRSSTINGHDMVVVDYAFSSVIVTDPVSPGLVDPNLPVIGGSTSEKIDLPADPELLLERTGYACMDENEFPPGSVFEENTWYFYDDTCTTNPSTSLCHVTVVPNQTCKSALANGPGRVPTTITFTRIPYESTTAGQYRVGHVNPQAISAGSAADLSIVESGMTDEHDFAWRFFGPGSCELGEGVIGEYGWRRILMFSAIVQNDGTAALDLGNPADPANPYAQSNVFAYSPCHHHYHFSHYGIFTYSVAGQVSTGSKRAFCLEDTNRYHNDESTPLTASHQTCQNQGMGAGWGDEYNFGIPGQWVDVTGMDTSIVGNQLTFSSNPDQFLCEGVLPHSPPIFPQDFSITSFINEADLQPEYRVNCGFLTNWNSYIPPDPPSPSFHDNYDAVPVTSPGGGFVTDQCTRGQIGPKRNCGFTAGLTAAATTPGTDTPVACASATASAPAQQVSLSCRVGAGAQPAVVRICEVSGQSDTGVACTLANAVANVIVGTKPTAVQFSCPAVRDAVMTGSPPVPQTMPGVGGYSIYRAALGNLGASDNEAPAVTCTGH